MSVYNTPEPTRRKIINMKNQCGSMYDSLIKLNKVFSNVIIEKCKDKKVLLTLSGGLDTRAMLSVLCKYGIHCDALTHNATNVPWDVKIAKKIAKDMECIDKHILIDDSSSENVAKKLDDICPNYDIVLRGEWISGFFDKYEHMELSENEIEERIKDGFEHIDNLMRRWPNTYFPATEKSIQEVLKDIPIFYRFFHYPQKTIIMLNYPKLMKYPYTTFNLKKRIARIIHWKTIWVLERLTGVR